MTENCKERIETLKENLTFRYACKAFNPDKKLTSENKEALIQSLVLSPSSFGLQLWKFFIIENAETREKLKAVSWNQGQVTDADFHVVFAVNTVIDEERVTKWVNLMGEIQGTPAEALEGYKGAVMGFISDWSDEAKIEWAKKQAYLALGQFMASAASLKVDTCPMEGIDPAAYDEILDLKSKGYTTAVACSVGYRSDVDKYASAPKARFSQEEMVEVI